MKRLFIASAALAALAASPAMARDSTHISFGFYSPAPVVVHHPAPVYYAPVHYARVTPPRPPCPPKHAHWKHHKHHPRDYAYNNDWNYRHGYWR